MTMLDAPENPIVILHKANHLYEVCAPINASRDTVLQYVSGRVGRPLRVVAGSEPQLCTVGAIDRFHWLLEVIS